MLIHSSHKSLGWSSFTMRCLGRAEEPLSQPDNALRKGHLRSPWQLFRAPQDCRTMRSTKWNAGAVGCYL